MKVILKDNVRKVGAKHEVVEVSDGYALNFLIPSRLAEKATPASLKSLEQTKEKTKGFQSEEAKKNSEAVTLLNGKTFEITRTANENGHLFAKVSESEIAESLSEQSGSKISEDIIVLSNPIKEVGEFEISLVSKESKGSCTLNVKAA